MVFAYFDRVKETSTTTGTGNVSLAGAVQGFRTFSSVYSNADTMYYCIQDQAGSAWEVGLGTFNTGPTLSRSVISSSNSNSLVNFTSGALYVFVTVPAQGEAAIVGTANQITVTNANTTTGAPTLSLPTSVKFGASQTIGGSATNVAVLGGSGNECDGSDQACIAGNTNFTDSTSSNGVVVGGTNNSILSSANASMVGGASNFINTGIRGVVIGGTGNSVSSLESVIVGGSGNSVFTGVRGVVIGGAGNSATGTRALVVTGLGNNCQSQDSAILGGNACVTNTGATNSLGSGISALATNYGQNVRSGGIFASAGDAQSSQYITRCKTTNNSATITYLDGSTATQQMVIATNTCWTFVADIVGWRTDSRLDGGGFQLLGVIKNTAGTVALVGSVTTTVIARDDSSWTASAQADNTGKALQITVTGDTGQTVQWVANIRTVETTG